MFRTRVILAATVAAVLLMAMPALAQYPPTDQEPSVSVSTTAVVPGEAFTVAGSEWLADSTVTISLGGVTLGTATVNAAGQFSTQVTVPANTTPGQHVLRVSGLAAIDGAARTVDMPFTVVAPAAPAPPAVPGLPRTGGLLTTGGALAALLLVVGAGAVFAGRRLERSAP